MPFCPNCGREYQPYANFCSACGHPLPDTPVTTADSGPMELPYYISLKRIILMTVLTWGMYLFYWFYLTWKQYRDHTGNEAYPVWHALALTVNIYAFFRAHAHARTFRALMWDAGMSSSIRPGWTWVLLLISIMIFFPYSMVMINSPYPLSPGRFIAFLVIYPIAVAQHTILLGHIQSNLNRYWRSLPNVQVTNARIGVGEVIFGVVGGLFWLITLADIFS